MTAANGASVDELLRYMLLIKEEERVFLEQMHASDIRVGPCGRYGCRLLVQGHLLEFKLGHMPDDSENFLVTKDGIPMTQRETGEQIFKLARHRAAEMMLGVRAGHHEYNLRRVKKRNPGTA